MTPITSSQAIVPSLHNSSTNLDYIQAKTRKVAGSEYAVYNNHRRDTRRQPKTWPTKVQDNQTEAKETVQDPHEGNNRGENQQNKYLKTGNDNTSYKL